MPKCQLGGILYIFPPGPRGGGGVSIFSPKTQKCFGSRRDPNHKSMYKCAYMYVHLSLSPPPPPLSDAITYFSDFKIIFS